MKRIGQIVSALGAIFLLLALLMDTTVGAGGMRVHNIGLLSDRQTYLFFGVALLVAGLVLITKSKIADATLFNTRGDSRSCPFCAETIKARALICRYCGKSVEPISSVLPQKSDSVNGELSPGLKPNDTRLTMDRWIAEFEHSLMDENGRLHFLPGAITSAMGLLARHQRKLAFTMLGLFAVVMIHFFLWMRSETPPTLVIYQLCWRLSILISGILLLNYSIGWVTERVPAKSTASARQGAGKTEFTLFGDRVDIWTMQGCLIVLALLWEKSDQVAAAVTVALLASLGTVALCRLGSKIWGLASGLIAVGYLMKVMHRNVDSRAGWDNARDRLLDTLESGHFSLYPYLVALVIATAIPHLHRIQLGTIRFGDLPGDVSIPLGRHQLKLNFSSALMFGILFFGLSNAIFVLVHLPRYLKEIAFG